MLLRIGSISPRRPQMSSHNPLRQSITETAMRTPGRAMSCDRMDVLRVAGGHEKRRRAIADGPAFALLDDSPHLAVIEQVLGAADRQVVDARLGDLQQKIVAPGLAGRLFRHGPGTMTIADADLDGDARLLLEELRRLLQRRRAGPGTENPHRPLWPLCC